MAEEDGEVPDEDSHPREWILFTRIDLDGDRKLQKSEVEAYFEEQGMESIADMLMDKLDEDGDGEIDFGEFVKGYHLFKKAMDDMWKEFTSSSPTAGRGRLLASSPVPAEDALPESEPGPEPESEPEPESSSSSTAAAK
eukprot:COSAG01_NODE_23828_length_800_cov_1.192582_1_plen_139_part_00